MDDEYYSFQEKLKRFIHLEVLLQVLNRDKRHLRSLKMARVYSLWLDSIMDRIVRDLTNIRIYFRKIGTKILEKKLENQILTVSYLYKGYENQAVYMGEFMKATCEGLFKEYISYEDNLIIRKSN